MNQQLLKFTVTVLIVSAAFIAIPIVAMSRNWIQLAPTFAIEIVFTLALITTVLFNFLVQVQKSNPHGFVQRYMLSITIKMVVGGILILVVIFMDRAAAMANALLFILYYFVLTGIEIFFLLSRRKAG